MKCILLIAIAGVLGFAVVACTDVGDDSSSAPFDAAGADQTTVGFDASSGSQEDGNGNTNPGDASTPVHDGASASADGPLGDSTLESGSPEGGADAGKQDASVADSGTADTGTHDTGTVEASAPDADVAALNAHCAGSNDGGPCTATELLFIEHDTNPDGTGKGGATPFGCYDCMVSGGCIDDRLFSSDVNHECGDTGGTAITQPTLSGGDAIASCLALVSCVFANGCTDARGSGTCYCGTAIGAQCTTPGAPDGRCLTQEQDALDTTDPVSANSRFTNNAYAGGMANTLFACAASNTCTACN